MEDDNNIKLSLQKIDFISKYLSKSINEEQSKGTELILDELDFYEIIFNRLHEKYSVQ